MKDFFECTCGYETSNEINAITHAIRWHLSDAERKDLERAKTRIRTMISSPFREFSFDAWVLHDGFSPIVNGPIES